MFDQSCFFSFAFQTFTADQILHQDPAELLFYYVPSLLINILVPYSCKFMHIGLHCSPSGSGRDISVFNYPISHSARFIKMADWGEFCSTRAQSSKFHFDVTISFSVCFVPLRRRRVRTSRFWC